MNQTKQMGKKKKGNIGALSYMYSFLFSFSLLLEVCAFLKYPSEKEFNKLLIQDTSLIMCFCINWRLEERIYLSSIERSLIFQCIRMCQNISTLNLIFVLGD